MLKHNLNEFRRDARRIAEHVERNWLEGAVDIASQGYEALLQKTGATGSIDTGAYLGEHVIEQGGRFVYENPERVGPDRVLPRRKRVGLRPLISPPSPAAVRSAVAASLRPGGFGFANRRFYGPYLEDGTAQIEPRHIYATAEDETRQIVNRVARERSAKSRHLRP